MVMFTRRKLMVGAGLAGGGVLLGFALAPFSTLDRARKLVSGDGALLVTWVRITPDNRVTVIVPHSEMGQG
ncbi:MAG: hypothetical protein ABL951_06750, partial [Alphaproteobacteria bacterium]